MFIINKFLRYYMAIKKTNKKKTTKKTTKKKTNKYDKIISVLQGSTKFKMNVSLVIMRFDPKFLVELLKDISDDIDRGRAVQISQGTNVIVLLCEETLANELKRKYKKHIISIENGLVAYTILFPKEAVNTPGILNFISDRFAKNKINIREFISTYTEVTFVIERKDLFKAMDILGQFIA
jgi:aspartokinase